MDAGSPARVDATPIPTVSGIFSLVPPTRDLEVFSLWHAMLTTTDARKRSLEVDENDESPSDGDDDSVAPKKKKKKKPTYVARKEETARLEQEVKELETRIEKLKETTGITTVSSQIEQAVGQQQVLIAKAQSVLSEFTNNQQRSPIECFIHLARDWHQRQATLSALRGPKLDLARRFLAARTQYMPLTKVCSEVSEFQQDDESFCTIKLSVTPFRGLRSAKQVYDALQFYITNMEINISMLTGKMTLKENHDEASISTTASTSSSTGVLCHRLVTNLENGLAVEKNSIQFLSSPDPDSASGDEFALLTSDFVNVDELYPYLPDARLRKDLNTVIRITSHREGETDELVVVLTYWMYIKTHVAHLSDRSLSTTQLERVHDHLVHTMEVLPVGIRQNLYGAEA